MAAKMLGRTALRLSPFGVALDMDSAAPPLSSFDAPPNWCDVTAEVSRDAWARLVGLLEGQWSLALSAWAHSADRPLGAAAVSPEDDIHRPEFFLAVRIGPGHWDRSMAQAIDQLLWRTGQPQVDLLQLAPFDLERIKAGEPFRRLVELRDSRRVRFFGLSVSNLRDARWAVEETPAHAVAVHASYHEPGWTELFDAANQADTGLIAGPAVADNDLETARRLLTDTPVTAFTWPADIH